MPQLVPLSDLADKRGYDLRSEDIYDPTGETAYARDSKVGRVDGALADDETGRLRYLIVNVGGWFSNKDVLVPVGMARVEDDGVYFDSLTKDQVKSMMEYRRGMDLANADLSENDRVATGRDLAIVDKGNDATVGMIAGSGVSDATAMTGNADSSGKAQGAGMDFRDHRDDDEAYRAPGKLQLLEERLLVDKRREKVGEVVVGKRVETQQASVGVDLSHDEVVIERRPVTDMRPVEGNATLGAAPDIRVEVEADRADVRKQAFVAEEVEVSKRQSSETRTFNEEVGREVLDVERTGDARLSSDAESTLADSKPSGSGKT